MVIANTHNKLILIQIMVIHIYIYIYIYTLIHVDIYIYIYIHREREMFGHYIVSRHVTLHCIALRHVAYFSLHAVHA